MLQGFAAVSSRIFKTMRELNAFEWSPFLYWSFVSWSSLFSRSWDFSHSISTAFMHVSEHIANRVINRYY